MTTDLGTYHVRVMFTNGAGYLHAIHTGRRYTHGNGCVHPLTAHSIAPPFANEQELFDAFTHQFLEGNYSCDCNRRTFLDQATGVTASIEHPCGHTLTLQSLTAIRPDGSECLLYAKTPLLP